MGLAFCVLRFAYAKKIELSLKWLLLRLAFCVLRLAFCVLRLASCVHKKSFCLQTFIHFLTLSFQANRIVLLAVISEFFFSFIPQFFNGLFAILNIDDSFLGSYLSATGGIDALVVAIVYRRSIMRRFNQVEPKLIGPSTTGQAPSNNTMLWFF